MTYSVNEHVTLELRIVEEALFARVVVALELAEGLRVSYTDGRRMSGLDEGAFKCCSSSCGVATYEFVAVHRHMLFQRRSVVENFGTGV